MVPHVSVIDPDEGFLRSSLDSWIGSRSLKPADLVIKSGFGKICSRLALWNRPYWANLHPLSKSPWSPNCSTLKFFWKICLPDNALCIIMEEWDSLIEQNWSQVWSELPLRFQVAEVQPSPQKFRKEIESGRRTTRITNANTQQHLRAKFYVKQISSSEA